jgi:hypothetical protein
MVAHFFDDLKKHRFLPVLFYAGSRPVVLAQTLLIVIILAIFSTNAAWAQQVLHATTKYEPSRATAREVLESLGKSKSIVFAYDEASLKLDASIVIPRKYMTVKEILDLLSVQLDMEYELHGKQIVLKKRRDAKYTVSGYVRDAASGEELIGATIYVKEIPTAGALTNTYGFYSITLPEGNYTVIAQYIGYNAQPSDITLTQNVKHDFALQSNASELEEVVITAEKKGADIETPEMSVNKLSISTIKKMPVVLGEVDVIKSILQLPGVTNSGEGSGGFNVRGGATDQNLILLDEAVVFNSSHLFGFFSVFNSDVIKDLKLYKGGIPARFGGRASSVLDIYQKEGNNREYHVTGGVGTVSARLAAEGPIVQDKSSFIVAGRASYAHLFLKLTDNKSSAYFYDLNAKLSYNLNANNSVFLSGYFGRDFFNAGTAFKIVYGNSLFNARWNHVFSDKIFSNLSVIYNDYYYGMEFTDFKWDSGIKNYNIKYDFDHFLSNTINLNYGVSALRYDFNPGTVTPVGTSLSVNPEQLQKKYAYEPAVYINASHKLTDALSVNYGVRYSMFYRVGEEEMNTYANNQPVLFNSELQIYEKATPTGTIKYGSGKTIKNFGNLEPRLAVSYSINQDQAIKASYSRMAQYIHLLSNAAAASPLDVWTPSGNYIKPQLVDQYALGYFRNLKEGDYSIETETFYKTGKNRIDYIDGANLIANRAIEQVVLNGETRSYGLELLLRKNEGKLQGWISYTLSRADQRTPGRTTEELGINNGEWYRANYDKLHNLSITGSYTLTRKWAFGAIMTYQTGRAVTYPKGQYVYQGIKIPSYGLRNENTLPAYHHLDVSATYTPKPDRKTGWRGEWVFSVYNLYNRQNAASISFQQNQESGSNEARRFSIFGIVPSVTYNFKF